MNEYDNESTNSHVIVPMDWLEAREREIDATVAFQIASQNGIDRTEAAMLVEDRRGLAEASLAALQDEDLDPRVREIVARRGVEAYVGAVDVLGAITMKSVEVDQLDLLQSSKEDWERF